MIGIATCRLRIESQPAGCIQVLGLESQPRSESQPAGCRLLGLESQLAGCDSIRNLRSAGCELNRNLRDAGFGTGIATCRLRIESQPAGCRFWDWNRNFDSNRNLWVAGFIGGIGNDRQSQLAGCELNRNLAECRLRIEL